MIGHLLFGEHWPPDLSSSLHNTERKEGKLHSAFEPSFDGKECRTEKFIQQKLDYIH